MKNDEDIKLGKEVDLYLPYQRLSVYDKDHNKANSRENIYKNSGIATLTHIQDKMIIKVGGATLTYPSMNEYPDGEYNITFKQDKLLPLFNKKMLKAGHENPEMENPKNVIKVSAYDEDVLGSTLLTYVEVKGFENYASFVVPNNFSVYKMPKFELYVPIDGFELSPR